MNSLGVVFPGQGSQTVGMLQDFADFSETKNIFLQASQVLDYDLWNLVQNGPAEELDKTVRTQPALLTASYALWRILKNKNNLQTNLLAGHSLGEYTALVCAEAIDFKDAVKLVAARGQFMQDAVPEGQGALAAIVGLEDDQVQSICDQARLPNEVLAPANFNSPGQIVISGHALAVDRAIVLAQEAGARLAKKLSVSVPSHCNLMKPAAERLAKLLASLSIQKPKYSVINNVDVKIYENENEIRDGLVRQLFMPVRWVETIQDFAKAGINHILECGPGKVLTGLNKRIAPGIKLMNINDIKTEHSS